MKLPFPFLIENFECAFVSTDHYVVADVFHQFLDTEFDAKAHCHQGDPGPGYLTTAG